MHETLLLRIAVILIAGIGAQWLAWRMRLPSIVWMLGFGIVLGPISGFLNPDELFGPLLLPLVSLSVALILYEGGLSLRITHLVDIGSVVRNLVSIGAVITWCVATIGAYLIFDLDLSVSVLLGAILVVTGPTVIGPLLRLIRPAGSTGRILHWEGILIDPIGAMLAVLVFESVLSGGIREATEQAVWSVAKTIVFGGGLGVGAAATLTLLIYKRWVPEFLQNALSLMLVVAVYATCHSLQHESGLLAVTVMGVVLSNQKYADVRHIVEFKENLRVLLISSLFVVLAARLKVYDLRSVLGGSLIFLCVLVFLARPLAALTSTIGARLSLRERLLICWMAPRGIVAAAVASVFALRLESEGFSQARLLVPITFSVIIGTVVIYGLTSAFVARRLGVADPDPQGVLIVGAHSWARDLATVLQKLDTRVLLVDSNRHHTAAARMAGLPTYTGSALAEYLMDELDLGGIGRLVALTPNDWVNALAAQRFRSLFGRGECYQLPPEDDSGEKRNGHKHLHGRWLFGVQFGFAALERAVASGAVLKATRLTELFGVDEFRLRYGDSAILLCAIDPDGKLKFATAGEPLEVRAGVTLISLVKEEDQDAGS